MAGEFRRYVTALRKWGWLMLLGVMVTATGTSLLVANVPNVYAASTIIKVSIQSANNADYIQLLGGDFVVTSYQPIITGQGVMQAVADQFPGMTAEQIKQATSVTIPPISRNSSSQGRAIAPTVTITVTLSDPQLAAKLANAIATTFIQQEGGLISQNAQTRQAQAATLHTQLTNQITALNQEITVDQQRGASAAQIANLQAQVHSAQTADKALMVLQAQLAELQQRAGADLVQMQVATPPTQPVDQQTLMRTGTAAGGGLLLAIALAIVFEALDDHARRVPAVEQCLAPVLGVLPKVASSRVLVKLDQSEPLANAYRTLRARLGLVLDQQQASTLLITSVEADSGTAVATACNLALSFAQAGKNVLLVDANMAHPALHTVFGFPNEAGFSTALLAFRRSEEVDLRAMQTMPVAAGVTLMTAGPAPASAADLLDSIALQRFLESLNPRQFDLTIFVGPPAVPAVDAMIIGARVGGVLVTVDAARTRMRAVAGAKSQLDRGSRYLLGAVLCRADMSLQDNILPPAPPRSMAVSSAPVAVPDVTWQETQRQPVPAIPANAMRPARHS